MITELTLAHYKSISDQTVGFSELNVLVGKNGSGKSNIVDALSFLSDMVSDDLDYAITRRHGSDSVRQWSKFRPYHVTIAVRLRREEGHGYYKLVFSSSRNTYRIIEEVAEWSGETTYGEGEYKTEVRRTANNQLVITTNYDDDDIDLEEIRQLRLDPHRSILTRGSDFSDNIFRLHWLYGWIALELRSLSTFSIFPNTIRAPQIVSRGLNLESDGSNIASILKQLPVDRRRQIVRSLKVVMPQLSNITVKSAAGYYVPVFLVTDAGSTEAHELNMAQISDGTLRILGMLTALFQPHAPSKIVIEEPEQMIHPALLIVVRDAVLEYIRKTKGQVFITTHSSVLMDLFDVSNIIAVEYGQDGTRCGPVSPRQAEIVRSGLMTLGDVLLAEDLEIA